MAKDTAASIKIPMILSSFAMVLILLGQDYSNITTSSGIVIVGAIGIIVFYLGYYIYLRKKESRASASEKEGS